ncbi:MAG: hypothetical protein ACM3IK_14570 [Sphingomonadaceae bacterium]
MGSAMPGWFVMRRCAQLSAIVLLALAAGCVSEPKKIEAIQAVNEVLRADYERILAEDGTHTYNVPRDQTFDAMRVAFGRLGMLVADQSPDLGYISVYAPAPRPITDDEWRQAANADLPMVRQIVVQHVGWWGRFFTFEAQGLDIVVTATAIPVHGGTSISLTMRMREVAPPETDYPRREYAPPTGVRMGLRTIWAAIERELPPGSRRL